MINFKPPISLHNRSNAALLAAIQYHLPEGIRGDFAITDIEIIWTMKLDDIEGRGVLIVYTAREVTCHAGNRCSGLDCIELAAIESAVRNALHDDDDDGGLIESFIVRQQQRNSTKATALRSAPQSDDAVHDEQPWLPGLR